MSKSNIYYSKVPFTPESSSRFSRLPGLVNRFADLVEIAKKNADYIKHERTVNTYFLGGVQVLEVDIYGPETTTHIIGVGRVFEGPHNHSYYDIDAGSLARLESALRKAQYAAR
jgi:hypothetical protein